MIALLPVVSLNVIPELSPTSLLTDVHSPASTTATASVSLVPIPLPGCKSRLPASLRRRKVDPGSKLTAAVTVGNLNDTYLPQLTSIGFPIGRSLVSEHLMLSLTRCYDVLRVRVTDPSQTPDLNSALSFVQANTQAVGSVREYLVDHLTRNPRMAFGCCSLVGILLSLCEC